MITLKLKDVAEDLKEMVEEWEYSDLNLSIKLQEFYYEETKRTTSKKGKINYDKWNHEKENELLKEFLLEAIDMLVKQDE